MTLRDRLLRHSIELFGRSVSLRFILIGCINTAFSYSIFALLLFLGLSVELGSLLALIVGIFFTFYTQGTIVFGYLSSAAFARFVAAWAVMYLVNLALIRSLMALGASPYLGGAIATGPVTIISYFIQKLAVFRPPAAATPREENVS